MASSILCLLPSRTPLMADEPPQKMPEPPVPTTPPDESILGEVVVTGSVDAAPLPKLAVVPIVTTSDADSVTQLVVRRDLDLSGQFDVLDATVAPEGAFTHETAIDQKAWKSKGAEIVVRVLADVGGTDVTLTGEVYLLGKAPKAAFTKTTKATIATSRMAAHKMVDAILGALTGRPGGFGSHLAYTARVGKGRQVFLIEADGANALGYSPAADTALSPTLGPGDDWYYALSHDYSPFKIAHGPKATAMTLSITGNVLGLAFSHDRTKLAVAVMDQGSEDIYVGAPDGTGMKALIAPPLASHPTFGPVGKLAYVAGSALPRVYVDKKPISPPGFHASAPTFCDTPKGLLVIFNVGVGAGADLLSTDVSGGNLTRLTQNQGANTTPACSPDGRLVAFFSTRKTGKGPGLYVMPVSAPWRSQRISSEMGESIAWEMDPP